VYGVVIFQLKDQAIMRKMFGVSDQQLMTAFSFYKFSFGPEFRVEFNDYICYRFITYFSVLAFDLEPLFCPF